MECFRKDKTLDELEQRARELNADADNIMRIFDELDANIERTQRDATRVFVLAIMLAALPLVYFGLKAIFGA